MRITFIIKLKLTYILSVLKFFFYQYIKFHQSHVQ